MHGEVAPYTVIVFKKKEKKKTRTQVWVKSQKLCHNCPAIYLFSWEGEVNPYVSNPVNTLKSSKVHLLTLKSRRRTCLDLQCIGDAPQNCPIL